ncbi:3-oxo-5a-steroid 4- dehydrogenase [Sorochytrium milnesiophthora]
MKITAVSRSGRVLVENLEIPEGAIATTADVKNAFHQKCNQVLKDAELLSHYKIQDGDKLTFKDLGQQIGYRTVFCIEYLGPILIHAFFYHFGHLLYGKSLPHTRVQTIAYYCIMLHFIKREFETFFVHRFSHATMPIFNVFKNSAHYWLLSGVFIAGQVYYPRTNDGNTPNWWIALSVAVFLYGEVSNYLTHVTLRNLRPPRSTQRKIPYGYGFNWVSCPNYFFETVAWIGVLMLTRTWTTLLFIVVAVGQMYIWAVKKHKTYRKEFPNYPRGRKAMFPLIA